MDVGEDYDAEEADYFSGTGGTSFASRLAAAQPKPSSRQPKELVSFFFHNGEPLCCASSGQLTWCGRLAADCKVKSHQGKRNPDDRPEGVYMRKEGTKDNKVVLYASPFVPKDVALVSDAYDTNQDAVMPKEAAMALFLEINSNEADAKAEEEAAAGTMPSTPRKRAASASADVVASILKRQPGTVVKKPRFAGDTLHSDDFHEGEVKLLVEKLEDQMDQADQAFTDIVADMRRMDSGLGGAPEGHTDVWTTVGNQEGRICTLEALRKRDTADIAAVQKAALDATAQSREAADAAEKAHEAAQGLIRLSNVNVETRLNEIETLLRGPGSEFWKVINDVSVILNLTKTLTAEVNDLKRGGIPRSGDFQAGTVVTEGVLDSRLTVIANQIGEVRQLVEGGGYKSTVYHFRSYADTVVFAKERLPADLVYGLFIDPITLLMAVSGSVTLKSEVMAEEVHYARVKRNREENLVVSSFRTTDPEAYGGPSGVNEGQHHFTSLKTHDQWNNGDGVSGTWNRIEDGLEDVAASYESSIEHRLEGYPDAQFLCKELLRASMDFLRKKSTFMSDFYRNLKVTAFGSETPGDAGSKMCWRVVTTCLRVFFQELRSARVVAENAFNYPDRANALYLWGVVQAHRVMKEFVKHNFSEHPAFHPKLLQFLFKTSTPRVEMAKMTTTINGLSGLPATLTALSSSVDSVVSRVNTLEQGQRRNNARGQGQGQGGGQNQHFNAQGAFGQQGQGQHQGGPGQGRRNRRNGNRNQGGGGAQAAHPGGAAPNQA